MANNISIYFYPMFTLNKNFVCERVDDDILRFLLWQYENVLFHFSNEN